MGRVASGFEQSADGFCKLPPRHFSFRYLCFTRLALVMANGARFSQIASPAEVEKFDAEKGARGSLFVRKEC